MSADKHAQDAARELALVLGYTGLGTTWMAVSAVIARHYAPVVAERDSLRAENEKLRAELEEHRRLLRSACAIAERQGHETHWGRFIASINELKLNGVTARTYRTFPHDE